MGGFSNASPRSRETISTRWLPDRYAWIAMETRENENTSSGKRYRGPRTVTGLRMRTKDAISATNTRQLYTGIFPARCTAPVRMGFCLVNGQKTEGILLTPRGRCVPGILDRTGSLVDRARGFLTVRTSNDTRTWMLSLTFVESIERLCCEWFGNFHSF